MALVGKNRTRYVSVLVIPQDKSKKVARHYDTSPDICHVPIKDNEDLTTYGELL